MKPKINYLSHHRFIFLWQFAVVLSLFFVSSTVMATNFNCKKAHTSVEKIICANDFISRLDDKLASTYAEEMKQATKKEKAQLIKYQKHWLKFTRNRCEDAKCIRRAYWSRLSDVSAVTYKPAYKTDENALKQILKTAQFYSTSYENTTAVMCQEILNGLKQVKKINFVKPKLTVLSYEDAALDPWKKNCQVGQSLVIYPHASICSKESEKLEDCSLIS